MNEVEDYKRRRLEEGYVCLYIFITQIEIKRQELSTENLYWFVGLDFRGRRRLLTVGLEDKEDSRCWINKLEEINKRGVKKILFGGVPNNTLLIRSLKLMYKDINIVISDDECISKVRKYFSQNYSVTIYKELKSLYVEKTEEEYEIQKEVFYDKYMEYKFILNLIKKDIEKIKESYKYSYEIRKMIFSYYYIRDFSKKVIQVSREIGQVKNIEEIIRNMIEYIMKTEKNMYCPKKQWLEILNQLYNMYNEEIDNYL